MSSLPANEAMTFITGRAGRIELKAAVAHKSQSNIAVVICHPHPLYGGTMENKVVTTLFRAFRQMGASVVRFNYRGVGQSEGEYGATAGEIEDLISVVHWLRGILPDHQLWLAGFSFGSYIAASAANQLQARQLITIAPAVGHFNFDAIDYPACPWLVIQGDKDEVVPPQQVFDWVAKQSTPPRLIKFAETTHFFHGKLTGLKQVLETEFAKNFK